MDPSAHENELPKAVTWPLFLASIALCFALCGLGLWAAFAPLATSIRANGTIAPSAPSYDVQHPFGGHIAQVMVWHQSVVRYGQIMFELDMPLKSKNLPLSKTKSGCFAPKTTSSARCWALRRVRFRARRYGGDVDGSCFAATQPAQSTDSVGIHCPRRKTRSRQQCFGLFCTGRYFPRRHE